MSTDLYGVRVLDVDPRRRLARLRVFVLYYERSWEAHEPLPDDPSFFFRVLWEGRRDRIVWDDGAGRPLNDLVTLDEHLNEGFVDDHTPQFIAGVRRLATRNHPMDSAAWKRLSTFHNERDGGWDDEQSLVQCDYEVEVTDARWLVSLRPGDSWRTTCYPTKAEPVFYFASEEFEEGLVEEADEGNAHAAFVLGWRRHDRGEIADAITAYRQSIEIGDADQRAKALLYLGDLYAAQGDSHPARDTYRRLVDEPDDSDRVRKYQALATLRLGTLLRELGDEPAALDAFRHVERFEDRELSLEARRLAGTET